MDYEYKPSMSPMPSSSSSPGLTDEESGATYAEVSCMLPPQWPGPICPYQILSSEVDQAAFHRSSSAKTRTPWSNGLRTTTPPKQALLQLTHTYREGKIAVPGVLFDQNFEQDLYDAGVYSCGRAPPGQAVPVPDNWDELVGILLERDEAVYNVQQDAFDAWKTICNNAQAHLSIIPSLLEVLHGNEDINEFKMDCRLSSMVPLFDSPILSYANPDFYDGGDLTGLNKSVREGWGKYLFPTGNVEDPAAPNFFLEAKYPDFPAAAARRLALYDGATGARAMLALQMVGREGPSFDYNAYTITSTLIDGVLKIYAVHPRPSYHDQWEEDYYMTELGGWYLFGSLKQLHQGLSAFKTSRAWAKSKRDLLIKQAIDRTSKDSFGGMPSVGESFGGASRAKPKASPLYTRPEIIENEPGKADSKEKETSRFTSTSTNGDRRPAGKSEGLEHDHSVQSEEVDPSKLSKPPNKAYKRLPAYNQEPASETRSAHKFSDKAGSQSKAGTSNFAKVPVSPKNTKSSKRLPAYKSVERERLNTTASSKSPQETVKGKRKVSAQGSSTDPSAGREGEAAELKESVPSKKPRTGNPASR